MESKLDIIKENLIKAKDALTKDETDDKIKAKLKAEMDKRNFGEADATRHVIDRDRGAKMPKPIKTPKPLLQTEDGGADAKMTEQHMNARYPKGTVVTHGDVCKVDNNGQWKIEKSNYGPKGMGLYNPADNANRKAKNTGEAVSDAGKNSNVKSYTTSGSSVDAARQASEAKQRKANPAPVKTLKDMSPEEKAALELKYNTKVKE